MKRVFQESEIPYFAWDRSLTVAQIKQQLHSGVDSERDRLAAWILREAATVDVWQFLTPQEVRDRFDQLSPMLGRRRPFWKYLLKTWHELGKL